MNKTIKIILCVFGTLILLIVGGIFFFKIQLIPKHYEDKTQFTIAQGAYGKEVFNQLEDEGIIRNGNACYLYIHYLSGVPIDFKAGTFELDAGLNLEEIVTTLSDDSKFYRPTEIITITEGSFLIDIAQEISNKLDMEKDVILDYWNDEKVLRGYMEDYPFLTEEIFGDKIRYKLEGYMFPSTYEFYVDSSEDEITRKFLDQTMTIYTKYEDAFDNSPVFYHYETGEDKKASIHEIFTMASILEWESGNDEQMDMVASVFYNRLNYKPLDMLRSSVTACYSLELGKDSCLMVDQDLNLAYTEDNETYNTYTKYGLPVGPISNPGETSIKCALYPASTNYYYFVGDICGIDGLTHFSTVSEGNEAISKKYVSCQ